MFNIFLFFLPDIAILLIRLYIYAYEIHIRKASLSCVVIQLCHLLLYCSEVRGLINRGQINCAIISLASKGFNK